MPGIPPEAFGSLGLKVKQGVPAFRQLGLCVSHHRCAIIKGCSFVHLVSQQVASPLRPNAHLGKGV